MIPKIIHYCWFGGNPLPELALKCIDSWKKYFPDYEIKEWNESNFDLNSCDYIKEAYQSKKWAFVSDYARFKILYEYGGLYFDTDVEIIKDMTKIVETGSIMGTEPTGGIAPGLGLGANPGLGLYKEILDYYDTIHFILPNGNLNQQTIVKYTTDILLKHGELNSSAITEIEGIKIYPPEYFCPQNYYTGEMNITENTCSIHHYTASWHLPAAEFRRSRSLSRKQYLLSIPTGQSSRPTNRFSRFIHIMPDIAQTAFLKHVMTTAHCCRI